MAQLNYVINPALHSDGDPSGLSNASMVLIKTALLAIALVALVASMRDDPQSVTRAALSMWGVAPSPLPACDGWHIAGIMCTRMNHLSQLR